MLQLFVLRVVVGLVGLEYAQLHARLGKHLRTELVRIRVGIHDLGYARVDEHLGKD